mgnify:CR=1 FL=1
MKLMVTCSCGLVTDDGAQLMEHLTEFSHHHVKGEDVTTNAALHQRVKALETRLETLVERVEDQFDSVWLRINKKKR